MAVSEYLQGLVRQMIHGGSAKVSNATTSLYLHDAVQRNLDIEPALILNNPGSEDVAWHAVLASDSSEDVTSYFFLDEFFDADYWDDQPMEASLSHAEEVDSVDIHFDDHSHYDFSTDPSDFD